MELERFNTKSPKELSDAFHGYRDRVARNNSVPLMRFFQRFSPISVFQPVVIELDDLGAKYELDVARQTLTDTDKPDDLKMHSESLWFLFKNTFGFDTLLVNGCLEETSNGGFSKAARALSVENLNNLGIRFGPGIFLETKILGFFFERYGSNIPAHAARCSIRLSWQARVVLQSFLNGAYRG